PDSSLSVGESGTLPIIGTSNITATQSGVTSNTLALTVTAAALQSITINAASSSIAKGTSDQFTATGTFSDGSTQNLTNSVSWTSDRKSVVYTTSTDVGP